MVSEDSERALELCRAIRSWLRSDLLPSIVFARSMRNRHEAWVVPLTNTHSVSSKSIRDIHHPHVHLCHLSLLKAEYKVYHTSSAPSFSYELPPNKTSNLKFPVVQNDRDFIVLSGLDVLVSYKTHTTAWQRPWVSHLILLREKENKIHEALSIFSAWLSCVQKS